MSRCLACNALIEYEYNADEDLCATCTDSVRKALQEDTELPRDYTLQYVREGLTPPRRSIYE